MDGVLRIDTKIDDKGFNAGTEKMSSKFGGILRSFTGLMGGFVKAVGSGLARINAMFGGAIEAMGSAISMLFTNPALAAILLVLGTIASALAFVGASIATAFRLAEGQTGDSVQRIKDRFAELKVAFGNAFLPILNMLAPYIERFISWLISAFNKVALIIAAILGQKQVLQVIEGSMNGAAQGVAGAAQKIEKASKGALAAFDQINVLDQNNQQDAANTGGGGGAGGLGGVATEMVPVEGEIVDRINAIKEKFANFRDWLIDLWDGVKKKIQDVKAWLDEFGGSMWQGFAVGGVIEFIKQKWEEFKPWFNEHIWQPFKENAGEAWEKIKQWASEAKDRITEKWGDFSEWFGAKFANFTAGAAFMWARFTQWASEAKDNILAVWQDLSAWFGASVLQPLMNGFNFALEWIRLKFESIFTGIQNTVINALNNIVTTFNNMLGNIAGGVASGGLAMNFGSSGGGSKNNNAIAPRIPRLATGAVIPPNAEFAAVLGDQRGGRNIETPESLLRQIVRDESGKSGSQEITIRFEGSMAQLVRVLKPEIDRENKRAGVSLVTTG